MLKPPVKKNNKYLSLSQKAVKLSITDIKIKSIKRLINGTGYNLTIYIPEETNEDIIKQLIDFDNKIIDDITINIENWFNKNLDKSDVVELHTKSFCNQTKTINIILNDSEYSNIIYNDRKINDIDNIIDILKDSKNKKVTMNICIEYYGLYFYSENTSNKWLIKSLDITDINDDIDEMFLIDDVIDKVDERFFNINKIMNEKIQKYNDIISEYTDDYNNIKKKIEDIKKNKNYDSTNKSYILKFLKYWISLNNNFPFINDKYFIIELIKYLEKIYTKK